MKIFLILSFSAAIIICLPYKINITFPATNIEKPGDELFESNEVLNIKLSGDLRELFNDRNDNAKYHSIILSYTDKDNSLISIPVRSKTRGNFRRKLGDCIYPPIWLDFSENKNLQTSLFKGQVRLKLVMPCRGDEYVIREYLLYRLYNLITEKSFLARLVRIETENVKGKKKTDAFYGILLEEDQQMAKRNHCVLVKRNMLPMQNTEQDAFLKMAVFEYLIGNTDWAVEVQQNIRLLAKDSLGIPAPVPYDFDHAGLVNAPYALPAEELQMSSVRERRYRGYCIKDIKQFESVITFYNKLKKDIYTLYTNFPLIDAKYLKSALQYLDEFYNTINNAKKLQTEFGYPCLLNGTGNIIVKGMKEN